MSEPVTVPPPPPAAVAFFGSTLASVERYAELLTGPAMERGLLGPREVGRLWERHLLNCAVISDLIPSKASIVDIGSGAGLPGIVLAIVRPDLTATLLEPMLRRVGFLEECIELLGLGARVDVRRSRVEDVAHEFEVDVATARAVAPLDRVAKWALPLLRPGGHLLAMKGERAEEELERARPALTRYGARDPVVLRCGEGTVEPPTTVVCVTAGSGQKRRGGRKR